MSKILIVDDEKSIRLTLTELLQREGYKTLAVPDALLALEMMDQQSFDVILTDIIMPRMSGMELAARIREKDPAVQIIVMTGEPTVETATQAVQSSVNDYLVKPVNKETLLRTVGNAVRLKTVHDDRITLLEQNQVYQRDLEAMVTARTQELQRALQGIILLISTVIESRDPYTAGHQRRVGNLAAAIAAKMCLDNRTIDNLRTIGYIHDVGKIAIPVEILAKPGKLSDLEMQMIRTHSQQGYEMLTRVSLPDFFAETIYQHHERLDGSGYPRGLRGREIMPETNIIVVADVVEAMMSHRPYRPALGLPTALEEIRSKAGLLYQPEVVRACIELLEVDQISIDDTEHEIRFHL